MSIYSTDKLSLEARKPKVRRDALAWLAVLGAPLIWLSHLQLVYGMVWWSFRTGRTWPMHIAVGISFLLCAGCGWAAWRTYRNATSHRTPDMNEVETERVRLMAHLGLWGTVLFILGIAGQWAAIFMVNPKVD